jgi:hypothetical protein
VLNVNDLTTMLASGSVTVNTGTGSLPAQVEDIIVAATFNWASANALALDAYRSVTINQPIADNGSGAVTLTTNDGGSGGTLYFGTKGSLAFLSTANALTIDGTPYTLVNSIKSLASAVAANASGAYALAASYDASADGAYHSSPVPTTLTGTVQGLGNAIAHLKISYKHSKYGQNEFGLFTTIGTSGSVQNLRLAHVHFVVQHGLAYGGGIAGANEGLLFGDHVSGELGDNECCVWGGLVAGNGGTIVQSSADVQIVGEGVGGLAEANGGTISLSQSSGTIEGPISSHEIGGLVGYNEAYIEQSFSSVAVTGVNNSYVGGLVGDEEGVTSNSYATGAVTGGASADVGGLEGVAIGSEKISSSYATGAVSAGQGGVVGGFLGGDGDVLSDCYWDTTTSGTNEGTGDGNEKGLTGLTTRQLQSGLPAGFDPTIWAESKKINNGFPYLINNPPQ